MINTPQEIKDLRKSLGLTQEQFAWKIGVTSTVISRWERGESRPSPLAQKAINDLKLSLNL